ncbi:uncharacterized protein LOC129569861 isoform X2 [Sitodiplosis mosellana]|uniref:uncharacterized protein LOC129569861 isoform X2 n=1 Tax=Sitodiplosis mosellana TaxID=263140 RepID=UPI0024443666|nr:uncharacterized protein LOC129569861 isoform X2 [Sitodiplosis mosellana]
MSSNWRPVLNNYLADFEALTSTALENMNQLLLQSGQEFDDRIRSYFVKSVNNRLEQTVEFFDIQRGSEVCENVKSTTKDGFNREATESDDHLESDMSSEEIEIVENDIKIESISSEDDKSVEIVSSSYSASGGTEAEAEATQPMVSGKNINRPLLDSSLLDERSICSPSTSNLPMMGTMLSPIDMPYSTPSSTLDINAENIKQEPLDSTCKTMTLNPTEANECVVKMEDVPTDPMQMNKGNELPSTKQANIGSSVPPIEPQPLKRQYPINFPDEAVKRQKITEETQLNEPSANINKNIVYACFYCHNQSNFYVETFAEVYEHWRSSHILKPFRFVAFKKAACFFCDKIDVFSNLSDHHKHQHHLEIFMVVDIENRSKCALCHKIFSLSEMVVHFKTQHEPMHYMLISSPICFTQNEIDQLLSVQSSQTHSHEEIGSSDQVEAFMCGHCNTTKNISEISFMQHLEQDTFQFKCSVCPFLAFSIDETAQHEASAHKLTVDKLKHSNGLMGRLERHFLRTRVIFNTGLVLYKHNMLNSTFDDRNAFWPFKERLAKKKLEECTTYDSTPLSPTVPAKQPESAPEKVLRTKQLAKQRLLSCDLHISGMDQYIQKGLCETFLLICEAMGLPEVTVDDVEKIYCRSSAINVRLTTWEMKRKILIAWRNASKNAQKQNQIHAFWMTNDGLVVKRNKKCKRTTIVWSKTDLVKCIAGSL